MMYPFFRQAAVSPGRQQTLRLMAGIHLGVLLCGAWGAFNKTPEQDTVLGPLLVTVGIIEGALLLGWRMTQLPKSQALEFLLASPLSPSSVFLAEAFVGLSRLALVTLAGLPFLVVSASFGILRPIDLVPLLLVPFTWGALTGLALTVWAYEPLKVRYWGERLLMVAIGAYLLLGVLAGEHLKRWLAWFSPESAAWCWDGINLFHNYNPFSLMLYWMQMGPAWAWHPLAMLEVVAVGVCLMLLLRGARRFKPHYHELHYLPATLRENQERPEVGDHPLSWWALKRVTRFAGRVNLWMSFGFCFLYSTYIVSGDAWPTWLGSKAFQVFDAIGGVPLWAAMMVVVAAVPAAFQYGLWDSSSHERCRKVELLLLTELQGPDYWRASLAAAWHRARGYLGGAVLLWTAALLSGKMNPVQFLACLSGGILLWGLYFTLGFRAYARGQEGNGLGILLTLGLPSITYACFRLHLPAPASLFPPGSIYLAGSQPISWWWVAGPLLFGLGVLTLGTTARVHCLNGLRTWYELHHGRKVMD